MAVSCWLSLGLQFIVFWLIVVGSVSSCDISFISLSRVYYYYCYNYYYLSEGSPPPWKMFVAKFLL